MKEYYIWTFPFANHLKITITNYTSMKRLLEDYILFEEHSHTPTIGWPNKIYQYSSTSGTEPISRVKYAWLHK